VIRQRKLCAHAIRNYVAVSAAQRTRQAAASEADEQGGTKTQRTRDTERRRTKNAKTLRRTNRIAEATVLDERAQESGDDANCGRDATCEELTRRRNSNRECMRRRRADPTRRAREKATRKNARCAAKADLASVAPSVAQPMGRVCSICHLRSAIEEIIRLEPSELTRSGYVQVRLPYCGRC
jgi:hypothetical protein